LVVALGPPVKVTSEPGAVVVDPGAMVETVVALNANVSRSIP
jgi:hypothetical protein